jgi:hypothetical protein
MPKQRRSEPKITMSWVGGEPPAKHPAFLALARLLARIDAKADFERAQKAAADQIKLAAAKPAQRTTW